ncbi:MAG: patatin-like phospholipase family protein [Chloroflexi bacterium]|nr:patatin-like phospholipase family protein [Chloroflexota bacterium]
MEMADVPAVDTPEVAWGRYEPEGTRAPRLDLVERRAEAMVAESRRIIADLFGIEDPAPGTEPAREALESAFEWVALHKGAILMRQGDPSDCLYVVISGRTRVTASSSDGTERNIAELGRGETIGEMGLLTGEPRSTTVFALRDTQLLRLSAAAFQELLRDYPRLLMVLTRRIIDRLKETSASRAPVTMPRTIAVIGASPNVPLGELSAELARALSTHGKTSYVNSALAASHLRVDQDELDDAIDDSGRLAHWLDDLELKHRTVLFEADAHPSAWTRRCIRQADRVLIVGRAGGPPTEAEIGARLHQVGADGPDIRRELVLLHPEGATRPVNSKRWLDVVPCTTHHQVRSGEAGDVARLGRRLLGRPIGLVLSGGGARAIAHLGVMRAMDELGIPIDLVVGSSAGAIISSLYAADPSVDRLVERSRELLRQTPKLLGLTLPIVSLMSSGRIATLLQSIFGNLQFEDLWLKTFCLSSSLTNATLRVHERGTIWEHLLASSALPGIFPPVLKDGELLIDGGLLDNLPIGIMARYCEGGPVIAVNASAEFSLNEAYAFESKVTGWQVLLHRLNPFRKAGRLVVPTITSILLRTVELASVQNRGTQIERAALYLNPPVTTFGWFEFEAFDRLVEVGYSYARPRLEAWLASQGEEQA